MFFFENNKGWKLKGWIFKADDEINTAISILFLHGNAGSILSHITIIKPLVERGFNVFIFDYSGFGFSEGKAKRKKIPADIYWLFFSKINISNILKRTFSLVYLRPKY